METINNNTWNSRSKAALILTGVLLLIVKSEYYWKQVSGLVPFAVKVAIAIIVITIIVMLVITSNRIYKEKGALNYRMFLPIVIYLFGLGFSFADPFNLNAESLQSKVVLKGHYNSIINSAEISFRENKIVEYEGSGFLGYTFFYRGKWNRIDDTLLTLFDEEAPIPWGDRLILYSDDKLLLPLDTIDNFQNFPGFLIDEGYVDSEFFLNEDESKRI